jgi:hypothetical protein
MPPQVLRWIAFAAAAVVLGFIGYGAGLWQSYINRERTLAMAWGDGRAGKAYYGAKVMLKPDAQGYTVNVKVVMGPYGLDGDDFVRYHDFGTIGHVATTEEATQKYRTIVWKKDGLHIGPFFGRRDVIERDR